MNQSIVDGLNRFRDGARGAARFRWLAMIVAWLVSIVGWLLVFMMPDVYESTARVYVDTRTALAPVIQGLAIQQDVASQLNLVQQSLVGEQQLQSVVRQTDLGDNARTAQEKANVISRLRQRIYINVGGGNSGQPGGAVYTISYTDSNRDRSLKVVQILLDSFVDSTLGGKRQSSETAQKFLGEQIREYEQRLRDAEQRLASFKKNNVGTMPGAEGDYFTRLQTEMDANRSAQNALSVALSRRSELGQQLRESASLATAPGAASASGATDGRPAAAGDTAGRIVEAQRKLNDVLMRYTEKHPEVSALRSEIAELEQRRARELDALRRGDPGAVASSGASTNPVYQSIQLALNQTNVEIAALRGQIAQREQKIAELRAVIQTVPEVEAEFARLNRDYDVVKTQYVALVERLGRARLGQDAEATSAVRLDIVNPPTASFEPVAPNRPRLVIAVFLLALGAGGGLAYLLSMLKPVFNDSRELQDATGLPVLGEVSWSRLSEYSSIVRRQYLLYAASGLALLVATAAVLRVQALLR